MRFGARCPRRYAPRHDCGRSHHTNYIIARLDTSGGNLLERLGKLVNLAIVVSSIATSLNSLNSLNSLITTPHSYFSGKPNAADAPLAKPGFVVRRVADVAVGRGLKKRSLLDVNEHFSDKPNAADAPLSQQNLVVDVHSLQSSTLTIVANNNVEWVNFVCLHLLPRLEVGGEHSVV